MGLMPVQEDRDCGYRHMREAERDPEITPKRQIYQSIEKHRKYLPLKRPLSRHGSHCTGRADELLRVKFN